MYKQFSGTPQLGFSNKQSLRPVLAGSLLIYITLIAGCGGGGGGSTGTEPLTDTTVEIAPTVVGDENLNWGLDAINTSTLNDAGGTGQNQLVAMIDTGIDLTHSEFEGKIHSDSYSYSGDSTITESNNHGTHVAGVIAAKQNGVGGKGVAYDASILSIGIIGNPNLTMNDVASSFRFANSRGAKVLNNSWVIGETAVDSISTAEATAAYSNNIRPAANELIADDSVFTWAAGNDAHNEVNIMAGLPYHFPELKDGWVAVVSINETGELSSFSNQCGKAAEWCIAAPGSDIYSTTHNGQHATYSGTSIAAPHVSGGLAALKSAFPNLTNQQILARMLVTANKTGIYSNSQIYGNGLVDLAAASAPVGDLRMSTQASSADAALASSSIVILPKTLLTGLDINTASTNVLLMDSFQDAPFWAKANQYIRETKAPLLSIRWSSLFDQDSNNIAATDLSLGAGLSLSLNQSARTGATEGFNLQLSQEDNTFSLGSGSGEAMTNKVLGLSHSHDWVANSTDGYIASGFQHKLSSDNNISINLGVATKNPIAADSSDGSQLLQSTTGDLNTAIVGGIKMDLDETSELSLQLGTGAVDTINNQTTANGAFAIDEALLSNIGLGLVKKIGDGEVITAHLNYANLTSESSNSLINIPKNIGLTTAKIGYSMHSNAKHDLHVDATVRKATGDDIQVRLPSSINNNGLISYKTYTSEVGNLYDERALEIGYNYFVNKHITLGMEAFWQQINHTDSDYGAIAGIQLSN